MRVHRAPFILATILVLLPAMCAIYWILHHSPHATSDDPATLLLATPKPKTSQLCPPRGAKQVTIQVSTSISSSRLDRNVDEAEVVAVSRSIEGTSSVKTDSGRRTQTSGLHPYDYITSHTPSSFNLSRHEQCPNLTLTAESTTPRGVTPNLVQDEGRPSPGSLISAHETITKSLYPWSAIREDQNDAPSQVTRSRELRCDPVDRTPAAGVDGATIFILTVAAGVDGLKDPKTDHGFILSSFQSPAIFLESLLDDQATRASIRHAFHTLYLGAQQNSSSQILVILTGLGDPSGNMCLFGNTYIGPQDFQNWAMELDTKESCPRPKIGVVFDICRPTAKHSDPTLGLNLAVVWSCSVGQRAYALNFGQDLPSSCFLVSLFLAAHDSLVDSVDFERAFKTRLAQQGALLRFVHDKRHENERTKCPANGSCYPPTPQESEYGEAGRHTLLALGEIVKSKFPNAASHVHVEAIKHMTKWRFLDSEPITNSLPHWRWMQYLVRGLGTKSSRGSTTAVAQCPSGLS